MFIKLRCREGNFVVNTDNISAYEIDSGTLFVNSPLGTEDGILHPIDKGHEKLLFYLDEWHGIEI